MFLRNAWYIAAWSEDVTDKPLARMLLGESIVLFRTAAGVTAALEDRCCHRAAALSMGQVVQKGLMCGCHGRVFNTEGKCVEVPGQSRIPERARVRTYPTVEKNEFVWLVRAAVRCSETAPTLPDFQSGWVWECCACRLGKGRYAISGYTHLGAR
jgi:phenylpropionate dioxygenase-like ring-hydroxylating dioxygenase large terminal subunit